MFSTQEWHDELHLAIEAHDDSEHEVWQPTRRHLLRSAAGGAQDAQCAIAGQDDQVFRGEIGSASVEAIDPASRSARSAQRSEVRLEDVAAGRVALWG